MGEGKRLNQTMQRTCDPMILGRTQRITLARELSKRSTMPVKPRTGSSPWPPKAVQGGFIVTQGFPKTVSAVPEKFLKDLLG